MYLKALRLKGFKSFPKQTELLFEPGVGVIIGPNGSGKSNLADAVIWALGEQSPTTVRGSSMQDVIFAGSDGRRASGAAEVELTFDNSDGALPLPTPEVSVRRRVARDGSSQYSINQSACRLTDVVELLAQVGLGKELHSIIGQGKVESFLAGKPEDRRSQIEEAAGLGAYKRRRERASLKLREVRRNLERALLLEREVGSQLAPLRRQATAAEQLRTVETQIAETRGRLLTGEMGALDAELSARRDELAAVDEERAGYEAGLERVAAARAREEETFARRLAERERTARRLLRARVLDGRLESVRRLAEQRLHLLDEVERAAGAERERLVAELAGRPEEPGDDTWPQEERRLAAELEAAETEHARIAAALEAARAAVTEQRVALERLAVERESALATAARLERRREALGGEQARLAAHHEAMIAEAAAKAEEEQAAAQAAAAAAEALRSAEAAAAAAAARVAEATRELAAAEEAHRATVLERRGLEGEADHLRAALLDMEDVGAEVLEVAGEFPGTVSLAGSVSCEPGYERALAAALSQLSGALAVPGGVDQWSLLEALKRAGIGLVRLVVPATRRPSVAFPGAAPLADKVSFGEHEGLEEALAHVVIVDDLRAVPPEFTGLAVTREGEYYRPADGQVGLASGVPAALLLERRASLERLGEKLDAVSAREVREEAVVSLAASRQAEARAAAEATAAAEREARIALETAERQLSQVRSRRRDLEEHVQRDLRAVEGIAAELAEAASGKEAAEQAAAEALLQTEQVRPAAEAAEEALHAAEADQAASLALVTRRRVELDERRAAAARAVERREAARRRAAADRERLEELERRLADVPDVRAACQAVEARAGALRAHSTRLIARLDVGDDEGGGLDRGELRRLADEESRLRRGLEEAGERRAQIQVALARLEARRAELAASLDEVSEQLDQAGFAPPADEAEAAELRELVERLTRRRDRIGPVNPLAEAECAELSERAAFLREQRRDLEKSIEDLEALIKELTAQVDSEFAATFDAVQEQFSHMVAVLFPGGRGRLKLVEPDEDHPQGGVAVEVKPAKKLGKRLQLLSGGERALVAIAFLMALVLARPCPFYILDEIEATLDDVNIGRLVQLLRDYRERTQFVIITHQKRTMEAADVLYGVTMGPDGASQVVSARMAEEEIEKEERARAKPPGAPVQTGD
ncbi:MAG: chromosome segregation protein SMC [Actinobacteria bacterium]|nr:chromosome segregation protein SMC [Actinomycetota bacterium]